MLVCAVAAGGVACGPAPERRVNPKDAVQAAQNFVKARLVSPGTAVFGGEADTTAEELSPVKYRVRSIVDYTGAGGATMRVPYTCVVTREPGGRWALDEMDLR